jgi:hypothetical protein
MTQPPDWDQILANTIHHAENGEEGLITFTVMSSNPVQLMFLTTHELKDDNRGLHNYGIHIMGQPPNFPQTPCNTNLMQRESYCRYLTNKMVQISFPWQSMSRDRNS